MNIFDEFKSLDKQFTDLMINSFDDAPFFESMKCVFDVLEYIYQCEENGDEVEDDIMDLYGFGYRYLNERFLYLNSLIDNVYKTREKLKEHYYEIDMLFYVMDFIIDANLLNLDNKELTDIQQEIFDAIDNETKLDINIEARVDALTKRMFKNNYRSFMESFEELADGVNYGFDDELYDEEDEESDYSIN